MTEPDRETIDRLTRELAEAQRLLSEERSISKAAEWAHKVALTALNVARRKAEAFDAITRTIGEFGDQPAACAQTIGEIVQRTGDATPSAPAESAGAVYCYCGFLRSRCAACAPAESAGERVTVAADEISAPGMAREDVVRLLRDALSRLVPEESASEGARFACDDCAVGRDCPEHDAPAESAGKPRCGDCKHCGEPSYEHWRFAVPHGPFVPDLAYCSKRDPTRTYEPALAPAESAPAESAHNNCSGCVHTRHTGECRWFNAGTGAPCLLLGAGYRSAGRGRERGERLMPYVETTEDLAEELANLCGAYGACTEACEHGADLRKACRACFVVSLRDRIRAAVRNDSALAPAESAGERLAAGTRSAEALIEQLTPKPMAPVVPAESAGDRIQEALESSLERALNTRPRTTAESAPAESARTACPYCHGRGCERRDGRGEVACAPLFLGMYAQKPNGDYVIVKSAESAGEPLDHPNADIAAELRRMAHDAGETAESAPARREAGCYCTTCRVCLPDEPPPPREPAPEPVAVEAAMDDVEVTREDREAAAFSVCGASKHAWWYAVARWVDTGDDGALQADAIEHSKCMNRAQHFARHRIASCAQLRAENAALRERLAEYAKVQLEQFVSDYSEEMYCAGWLHGIEWELWKLVVSTATLEEHDAQTAAVLRRLSEDAGGWVMWSESEARAVFVLLDEWKAIFARGGT